MSRALTAPAGAGTVHGVRQLLGIFVAGGLGSLARYLVSGVALAGASARFPWGTLAVNVAGCLAIGFLMHLGVVRGRLTPEWRVVLVTGFLGGLTTYSAFAYETFALGTTGDGARAALNVAVELALGLGAVWLGTTLARALP